MIGRSRQQAGALLRQGSWFGGFAERLQERFLDLAERRTFTKGQVIQTEEGEGVGIVAIVEGSVRFLRCVLDREPTLLHVAEAGFWFGHMTVFEGGRPVVTAVSRATTRAVVLTPKAFTRLAREEPHLETAVNQFVRDRSRITHQFLAQAQDLPAGERLAVHLADLADIRRQEVRITGQAVDLGLTQGELAEIVRLSRQQVNARLRVLQALGLVELGHRRIRVLDSHRLRRVPT